ncbi:MAG: hypothetical protein ABL917_01155 [Parcubacteria group bacterium]
MEEHVRVSGWGPRRQDEATTSITLSGIPKDQQEKVEGVTFGQHWMTVRDGKLIFSPAREPLPSPVEDTELLPYWRRHDERQGLMKELVFDPEERSDSPSFMVKHLCGYNYTPENYKMNAKLLESYGFVCMRSARGNDGKFWENWYLPGAWAANGALKRMLEIRQRESNKKQNLEAEKRDETNKIVSFLCRHVSFGQLDVVTQRAAMIIE